MPSTAAQHLLQYLGTLGSEGEIPDAVDDGVGHGVEEWEAGKEMESHELNAPQFIFHSCGLRLREELQHEEGHKAGEEDDGD